MATMTDYVNAFYKELIEADSWKIEKPYISTLIDHYHIQTIPDTRQLTMKVKYSVKNHEIFYNAYQTIQQGWGDCEEFARIYQVAWEIMEFPAYMILLFNQTANVGHALSATYTKNKVYLADVGMLFSFDRNSFTYDIGENSIPEALNFYRYISESSPLLKDWKPEFSYIIKLKNGYPDNVELHNIQSQQVHSDDFSIYPVFYIDPNMISTSALILSFITGTLLLIK